jgi:RNA recognition motif-containing protein
MEEQNSESKLFVGNLAWGVTSEDLGAFFSEIGEVASANVITDRQTGRSRGFGFVEMASADLAQKAVDELNEKELQGRKIVVNIAKPKAPRDDMA